MGDCPSHYRRLSGHEQGAWAQLEETGRVDTADAAKHPGKKGRKRTSPRARHRDLELAGKALKQAGTRFTPPDGQDGHGPDTADLAFRYLRELRGSVGRHGQLVGIVTALEREDTGGEELFRRLRGWWQAAARAPRSPLAHLWRFHVLPELPKHPQGTLVAMRGPSSTRSPLPHPGTSDLRAFSQRLVDEPTLRSRLAEAALGTWSAHDERMRTPLKVATILVFGGKVNSTITAALGLPRAAHGYEHVGAETGLGPRRLRLLDELYKLKRSWHMRLRPRKPENTSLEVEQRSNSAYAVVRGSDALARLKDKRDRVRDQLSKQIASAIVEKAVKCGCHGIAYENLDAYTTSVQRNRDENAKLRLWGHQSIAKHLEEIATLYGLGVRAVNPRGSSQFSALTNRQGVRVDHAPAGQPPQWWLSAVNTARSFRSRGTPRLLDTKILDTLPLLEDAPSHGQVLLPRSGGPLFADQWPPEQGIHLGRGQTASLIDADINAAANLGIRFLAKTPKRNQTEG